MHQLLCFKRKILDYFAFTLERYLFLLFLVQFINYYIYIYIVAPLNVLKKSS